MFYKNKTGVHVSVSHSDDFFGDEVRDQRVLLSAKVGHGHVHAGPEDGEGPDDGGRELQMGPVAGVPLVQELDEMFRDTVLVRDAAIIGKHLDAVHTF